MFREYQDSRIKRNLKIVKVLSLIALILWGVCTFTYLFTKWDLYDWMISHPKDLSWSYICHYWGGEEFWKAIFDTYKTADLTNEIEWDILYCLFYFEFAFLTYSFSRTALRKAATSKQSNVDKTALEKATATKGRIKQWAEKFSVESKRNNDSSNALAYTIVNFIPIAVGALLLLSVIIASMAGTLEDISDGVRSVSYHLGYMLLSYIFIMISSGFLIQNRILIKREWKTNPPQFLREEQQKAAEQTQKQKAEQDAATCKMLLDECGMQFFIEYYPQLKRLPISDINVSDHYFPERQVRLTAAKKIVDAGLTECALHYIIKTFGDVFPEEVIERAKTLLVEMEK